MEDDMLGTILFFAITIYFWLRCRNKDRAAGVRAFEDFEHKRLPTQLGIYLKVDDGPKNPTEHNRDNQQRDVAHMHLVPH